MKKKSKDPKNKWVLVRMNQAEYDAFYAFYKQSTCRYLSEYFRKVVLIKQVTIKYRRESDNEIMAALQRMKNDLNIVGKNLNYAVHELHMLDRIPEFRNWIRQHENLPQIIQKKLEEINQELIRIYWQVIQKEASGA